MCLTITKRTSLIRNLSVYRRLRIIMIYSEGPHWRNDTQHNDTQHNDTQHSDNQHNDTQHNDTQHNDTQHNDTQHNGRALLSCPRVSFILSLMFVAYKRLTLIVIMLNAVMLNVVAPPHWSLPPPFMIQFYKTFCAVIYSNNEVNYNPKILCFFNFVKTAFMKI
jgi:hypothetical protein